LMVQGWRCIGYCCTHKMSSRVFFQQLENCAQTTFAAIRRVFLALNAFKMYLRSGLCPVPRWGGAYSAPHRLSRACCFFSKNPSTLSVLGLEFLPIGRQDCTQDKFLAISRCDDVNDDDDDDDDDGGDADADKRHEL